MEKEILLIELKELKFWASRIRNELERMRARIETLEDIIKGEG